MLVVSKHLMVSHGSFRTTVLLCTILCTIVSGKVHKVFQVSLASTIAGCQHYRKHFGKLSKVAYKKILRTLKLMTI